MLPAPMISHTTIYNNPALGLLVLSQALPHALPATSSEILMLALPLLTQHARSLHVSRALVVGAVEETDSAEQNRLRRLNRTPAFGGSFVAVLVLLGRMEDGDAQLAVLVDVWVEGNRVLEGKRRRHVRIARRER
jgi:hypothetical protein